MDNIGVGGGNAGENKGIFGVPENAPSPMGEVPNFEEFLKSREDLRPQMEAPAAIDGRLLDRTCNRRQEIRKKILKQGDEK